MAQDHTTICTDAVCSSAEAEDWLAMELDEEKGCRLQAVVWCEANARAILSVASMSVAGVVLGAMLFG